MVSSHVEVEFGLSQKNRRSVLTEYSPEGAPPHIIGVGASNRLVSRRLTTTHWCFKRADSPPHTQTMSPESHCRPTAELGIKYEFRHQDLAAIN